MIKEMIKKAETYGYEVQLDSLGLDGTAMFFNPYFEVDENGAVYVKTITQSFMNSMNEIFG